MDEWARGGRRPARDVTRPHRPDLRALRGERNDAHVRIPFSVVTSVSVIVAVHNSERTLARAVRSVLGQDFDDIELLLIDDGSSDDSVNVARSFVDPRVRVLERATPSGGPATPRNVGLRAATGDWIALLDADDEWMPHKLSRQLGAVSDGSAAVYGRCVHRSAAGDRDYHLHFPVTPPSGDITDILIRHDVIPCLTAMFRRDWSRRVGLFDTELQAADDWHYWLRIALRGGRFAFVDEPLAIYHWHPTNLSRRVDWSAERRLLFEKLSREFPDDPRLRGELRRYSRLRRRRRFARYLPTPVTSLAKRWPLG